MKKHKTGKIKDEKKTQLASSEEANEREIRESDSFHTLHEAPESSAPLPDIATELPTSTSRFDQWQTQFINKVGQKNLRYIMPVLVFFIFAIILLQIGMVIRNVQAENNASNYDECVRKSSSVILDSFPQQCMLKNGKTFTQEISQEQENLVKALTQSKKTDFEVLKQGDGSTSTLKTRQLTDIKEQTKLDETWKALGNTDAAPAIIWNKEMVISLVMGEKPSGGHSVRVERVVTGEKALVVNFTEVAPGEGCMTTTALTSPYLLIKVPKADKEVSFASKTETSPCK